VSYRIALEVLDANEVWQDLTSSLKRFEVDGLGLTGKRASHSRVAHANVTLWNKSQIFNPDDKGIGTGLLDVQRRIRLKVTGAQHGKILQATHDGQGRNAYFSQTVTTDVASGDSWILGWFARAQFDSFANQDEVFLATSAETQSPTLYTYTNLGKYTLDRYHYPFAECDSFETEWRSKINNVEVMSLELMDLIQISDTQVGMTNHQYRAIRFDYSFDVVEGVPLAGQFRCYLERQDDQKYWILGHTASPPGVSLGKLDETARLYI
jgi:hypothetical protein